MTRTYRAGIIGLGYIGGADQVSGDALGQRVEDLDGTHIGALSSHPRVEVVAGSSRDTGRRDRFAERTGLPTFADWQELIRQPDLDIVSVATYTPAHHEITIASVEAGAKVVYCEKPIARTLAEAEDMADACDRAGTLLVINHNRRFHASARRLRDFAAGGGLGDLTSAAVQWPSGRLGNVGTHMFDTLRMITNREVIAVSGTLDLAGKPDCRGPEFTDPGGWGTVELEGNLICTVDARDWAKVPGTITLNGTEGRARTVNQDVVVEYWGGRSEYWKNEDPRGNGMDVAVHEIVDHLDGTAAFPCTAIQSVKTLEVIIGFHASHARQAARTVLPLTGRDREIRLESG